MTIGWRELGDVVEVFVRDEGPGIMNPENVFVPFFTTKPGGSGLASPSAGRSRKRTVARSRSRTVKIAPVAKPSSACLVRA